MKVSKKQLKPMLDKLEEIARSKQDEVSYHCDLLLERLLKVEDRDSSAKGFDLSYYKKTYAGQHRVENGSIKTARVKDIIGDLMYGNVDCLTLVKQMKKATWYFGTDKLPSANIRGGAYLGGVCDYTEHRGDDVEKMIEIMLKDYQYHPRTEQRLNYFRNSQRGGSLFDIVIYCPMTSGYQFMFGFSNDEAEGAVLSERDAYIERYNQRLYSLL